MTSQSRIDNFAGTDSEYIAYLESIVRRAISTYALPSPPRSVVRSDCDRDEADPSSIQFISYEPESHDDDSAFAKRPRWEREMDRMLHDLSVSDWSAERERVGLASSVEILAAFDMLVGSKPQMEPAICDTGTCYDASNPVLQLLDTFGSATATLKVGKTFATQIYLFHKFVFVSTCAVALYHGADHNEVDKIMRRHISSTVGKNLDRLRYGALWGNRMMNILAADGFGHMAYEYFLVYGRSLAQYGRFAEAGDDGFSYFRSRVPKRKLKLEIQAALPFWIPFIIKTRVGEVYDLATICLALGYDADLHTHDYSQYVHNYDNRRMPLPEFVGTGATAQSAQCLPRNYPTIWVNETVRRKRASQGSSKSKISKTKRRQHKASIRQTEATAPLAYTSYRNVSGTCVDTSSSGLRAPVNNSNSLGILLDAAEHIFSPDQQISSITISSNADQTGLAPLSEGLYPLRDEQVIHGSRWDAIGNVQPEIWSGAMDNRANILSSNLQGLTDQQSGGMQLAGCLENSSLLGNNTGRLYRMSDFETVSSPFIDFELNGNAI